MGRQAIMLLRDRLTETNDRPGRSPTGESTMTRIAKTAATVIALTLATHASGAYAGSIANPQKVSPVTPTALKLPTVTPTVPKVAPSTPGAVQNSTGFGSGVWQSSSTTPQPRDGTLRQHGLAPDLLAEWQVYRKHRCPG